MKKISILFFVLFTATILSGYSIDVPDGVLNTLKAKFPGATDVEWNMIDNNYQASFVDDDIYEVIFSADGTWLMTSLILEENDLPEKISEHINNNFVDANISEVRKVTELNNDEYYEVVIYTDDEQMTLKYSLKGELIED